MAHFVFWLAVRQHRQPEITNNRPHGGGLPIMFISTLIPEISGVKYRAIEAVAHQWAAANVGQSASVQLINTANGVNRPVLLVSTASGQLREDCIANLRKTRRIIDGGLDFNSEPVYSLTAVLEVRQ